jgi:hypothetical protein
MNPQSPPRTQFLSEDIQIVRATLESIVEDVRAISQGSADAIQEALRVLDRALKEFTGAPARGYLNRADER